MGSVDGQRTRGTAHKEPAVGSVLLARQGPQAATYPQKQRSSLANPSDMRAGENSVNFSCLLLLCELKGRKA